MKRVVALTFVLTLALSLSASAQTVIDFDSLGPAPMPQQIPSGYNGLDWQGVNYVSAPLYVWANGTDGYGPGFFSGPHANMVLIGGPLCWNEYGGQTISNVCSAKIYADGVAPNALTGFVADASFMAAAWNDTHSPYSVVVTAYLNGVKVGQQSYTLTTTGSLITFPTTWGTITELKVTPSPFAGIVMYTLTIN